VRTVSFRETEALASGQTKTCSWRSFLNFCFFFFKEKEEGKIISMFFFLSKKEPKSQEKVIGAYALADAAPLPFKACALLSFG